MRKKNILNQPSTVQITLDRFALNLKFVILIATTMNFTHLHVHSHYSLLDGLAKIDELVAKTKELGMQALALTDHGNLHGAVEFFKKAKAAGIKPIIGSEVYLATESMHLRRPNIDDKQYHLVLLVKNKTGYENLVKLVTYAHLDGFYYKPRIDHKLLKIHNEGLIALSGCLKGDIPKAITNGNLKKAEELALFYKNLFGRDFFLEVQDHPGLKEQALTNKKLIELGLKLKIPIVATNDVHYLNPEDRIPQDVLLCIGTNKKVEEKDRLSMLGDDFSLRSQEQMIKSFRDIPEAIENTQKIAQSCNFEFELGKNKLPYFEVPAGYNPNSFLKKICLEGLKKRYGKNPSDEVLKRMKYELTIIKKTGFASYFLIVQDFVNWAKSKKITVGPGRGSAAGSIVSYLLNITNVDPLKYNLLFERFLNPERISMPDIDLDFADIRRDEVINYVSSKYGKDHVAQIITFGTMAARQAIRDAGRALGYPYNLCDQIAKMIPMGFTLDQALSNIRELGQTYKGDEEAKKLIEQAKRLEGVARHASTHAAGIVISRESLNSLVPRQHPTQDDEAIVTQYEMYSIEDLGLLKIDLLGLKTLTVLENTIKIIKHTEGQDLDIQNIPLDDSETFELFQKGQTTGVFQFGEEGVRGNLKKLKPTVLDDLIAMTALYRPGPIAWIPDFIARKHGLKNIEYIHPKLKPILEKTYGVAVYQEQVLEIAKEIAGFSLGEADVLRKAVGKKIRGLLQKQKEKFIKGAQDRGISRSIAQNIFSFIEPFAGYGFNRAHATCYALLGYQTAYLKTHNPACFMAALMTSEKGNTDKIATEVSEAKRMGIEVFPPDINESFENFTVVGPTSIRFGLAAIKNVGHNIVKAIIKERKASGEFQSIDDLIERVTSADLNKKSLESLIKCGALDRFEERGKLLASMDPILEYNREIQKERNNDQPSLFGSIARESAPRLRLKEVKAAPKNERLSWERELLGLYVSEHPLSEFSDFLAKHTVSCDKLNSQLVGRRIKIGGIINKIKKIITRNQKPMLFVELNDLSSKIEVLVFPSVLERNPTVWQEDKIILVSGKLSDRDGSFKMLCDEAKEITK